MIRHIQTHRFGKARVQTYWWFPQDTTMGWRIAGSGGGGGSATPVLYPQITVSYRRQWYLVNGPGAPFERAMAYLATTYRNLFGVTTCVNT